METKCLTTNCNSQQIMGVKKARLQYPYYQSMAKRITINVGGRKFIVKQNIFEKFPYCILSNLNGHYYDKDKNEYFFDRDPDAFRYVLEYCRTGRLHVSPEECFSGLLDELDFFRIPTDSIYNSTCCEDECSFNIQEIIAKRTEKDKCFEVIKDLSFRDRIWEFFTDEESSSAAWQYSNFIHLVTIVSAVLIAFETVSCDEVHKCGEVYKASVFIINFTCVVIFTLDYLTKLAVVREKLKFIRGFLNFIDLLALLPFYLEIMLKYVFGVTQDVSFIAILRLFRVFRIIKIAKRSERLRTIGSSLFSGGGSPVELFFVLFGLFMVLLVFSTIIFFMEQTSEETQFDSIPETMWFTAVTITSLG